jgi:ornithine cyclodeaminase
MRQLPDDLLATADIVVDQIEASLAEAGEIIHALAAGVLDRSDLYELGAVLSDPPEASGRTVFKTVGVAAEDWAIAQLLADHYFAANPVSGTVGPQKSGGEAA